MRDLPGLILIVLCACIPSYGLFADGKMVAPRDYDGSVEQRAQEAVIIFHSSETKGGATEDLILKVHVESQAESFAWVIPFPSEPTVAKEDAGLFRELFSYVEARRRSRKAKPARKGTFGSAAAAERQGVEVLSRRVVGKYDVATVRENVRGALNRWLAAEGYQTLPNAEDVIGFYRRKGYVFTCVKVHDRALRTLKSADLHPLRFTFKTGGRDGIYFPMKMTGLQYKPFDVNLYVFYRAWLNDRINRYGYEHRGFRLNYRDWDSPRCRPNAGKVWSMPQIDPFLKDLAPRIGTVAKLFQKLHPGERYYLTNIRAHALKPDDVRNWSDDLWLFPYYRDRSFVPFDARRGEPASAAWTD